MESIYNLIPQEREIPTQNPRHTSKFRPTVKAETKAAKTDGKLFGPRGGVKPSTKQFLKKGDGRTIRGKATVPASRLDLDRTAQTILAAPHAGRIPVDIHSQVPRHSEQNTLASRNTGNYITTNRKETISMPARKVVPMYTDKPAGGGSRFNKDQSGLVPQHADKTKNPTYGKTPKYLTRRKQEIAEFKTMQTQAQSEPVNQTSMRQMSEDERHAILGGLRANWEQLHREYQGLSMFTDTIPKKTKRNNMEARLNQLESDINRFERHSVVYVDTR